MKASALTTTSGLHHVGFTVPEIDEAMTGWGIRPMLM